MRESLAVRRSIGVSDISGFSSLKAGAALGLGATLGVVATLIVAPLAVSANDDAGVRGLVMQDARARSGARSPVAPRDGAYAHEARRPSGFGNVFQPIVRSFAPQPRLQPHPAMPAAIRFGYGSRSGDTFRTLDQTGAPEPSALSEAAPKRTAKPFNNASERPARAAVSQQPRRTVCVRLCDGYHFPIGNLESSSDLPAHEMACQSQCPGAPVKLFTLHSGAESVEQAVARDLRSYASLAVAFNYRSSSQRASCTCQANSAQPARVPLLGDFTLRPGDTVVTESGARVLARTAWPLRVGDFADFRASRQLTTAQRKTIDSLVGVSHNERLLRPFSIARVNREAPTAEITIVRPHNRADIRRVDGPNGQRMSAARILAAAAPESGVSVYGPATIAAATATPVVAAAVTPPAPIVAVASRPGPTIITVESRARTDARPARRGEVIVTGPDPRPTGMHIVANRAAPGFFVLR